ncbi:hypothetical protein [Flavobacterium sp.]|uniref:hypothetical protein n=1 Tax=Flavobacterium sp. TaxID=239 RepID=UPI004033444D
MKTNSVIRYTVMASLFIAGLNIAASCDSCSRKDKTDASTYTEGGSTDTTVVTTTDSTETASGSSTGSRTRTANASGTGTKGSGVDGKTGAKGSGNDQGMTEQDITDKIENSSSTPRDANGKPVNSGGTSGSGTGTGTGSTGNNSKVTRPEDQKGN